MNVLAIDLSGKVIRYDHALFAELGIQCAKEDSFGALCPQESIYTANVHRAIAMIKLNPSFMDNSARWWKCRRLIKSVEGLLNYFRIYQYIKYNQVRVLHLEWLPYLDFCSLEKYILMYLKKHFPDLRIILTTHNIYPHNFSTQQKVLYRQRMLAIRPYIDHFIVHNQCSKETIYYEFNIPTTDITVIHHGLFTMDLPINQGYKKNEKKRLLMYGNQSFYKGTDLLIEALKLLPKEILQKVDITIMGISDGKLFAQYSNDCEYLGIHWINQYIDDDDLVMAIYQADALIYPYRSISQSGALLQGIYSQKPIILSRLPAFVETMVDYPVELFFNPNDAEDLAKTIHFFVEGKYDAIQVKESLQKMIHLYSWSSAAKKTWNLYKQLA